MIIYKEILAIFFQRANISKINDICKYWPKQLT
nr:MAG TPA: hypothetical protein [Bacteriophage sp.]